MCLFLRLAVGLRVGPNTSQTHSSANSPMIGIGWSWTLSFCEAVVCVHMFHTNDSKPSQLRNLLGKRKQILVSKACVWTPYGSHCVSCGLMLPQSVACSFAGHTKAMRFLKRPVGLVVSIEPHSAEQVLLLNFARLRQCFSVGSFSCAFLKSWPPLGCLNYIQRPCQKHIY